MRLLHPLNNDWNPILQSQLNEPYFAELEDFVLEEYISTTIYPPFQSIFSAFEFCSFSDTKVVILGQDPYHGPGQAHGLSFSVPSDQKIPPSLKNIFTEIHNDLQSLPPHSGNLQDWAKQGVLLLNSVLTVRKNTPASHKNKGWEIFTDFIIQTISQQKQHVVFLLWGKYACDKIHLIDTQKHLVLQAAHPSPFSVHKGFYGCKHFSQTNNYLLSHQLEPIQW